MEFEVEKNEISRIPIHDNRIKETLEEIGFLECVGVMAMYRETYVDAIKVIEVVDEYLENGDITYPEAAEAIKKAAEDIEDGTLCFYEL